MKQYLLIFFMFSYSLTIYSQRDTINLSESSIQKEIIRDAFNVSVSIYPVPVRDNIFTIKSDKEMSVIKITNIIGQDIYRMKYSSPLLISKIVLDNPRRGMYLVVILFTDNTRIVKKVMIEGTN